MAQRRGAEERGGRRVLKKNDRTERKGGIAYSSALSVKRGKHVAIFRHLWILRMGDGSAANENKKLDRKVHSYS